MKMIRAFRVDSLGGVVRDDKETTIYNGVLYHPPATAALAGPSHYLPIPPARVFPPTYPNVLLIDLPLVLSCLFAQPFRYPTKRVILPVSPEPECGEYHELSK